MKRKIIALLLVCMMFATTLLTGCGAESTDSSSSDDSVITIEKSEEASKYEEEVLSKDGVKSILQKDDFESLMLAISNRGEQVLPECDVKSKLDCGEIDGSKVYTLENEDYENVILYIHGGAWTFEISKEHISFCDDLATKLNAKVYMPLYPLSPQADSEETYAIIEDLYNEILDEGKNVYIMGDSAGGNLTLGLMYTIKDEGWKKPEKMVVIAPCSDMTFTNEEIAELDKTDPELAAYGCSMAAKLWAGEDNLDDPKNSAVYADVTGYPDTLIIQGTNDILYPDNMILYENMTDADVDVTLVKGEDLWHVFPIYPIPEKDESIDIIKKFCAE